MRLAGLVALWVPLLAQYDPKAPLPEHVLFLSKARAAAEREFSHLPSFVCAQTVDRWEKRPQKSDFRKVDSVRLQVAVTSAGETYAPDWATSFDDVPLERLVSGGIISTGEFSSDIRNIVVSGVATFEYKGENQVDGRTLRRFDYRIPVNVSGYQVRVPPKESVVGHQGSVWFDPVTLDVQSIEIRAVDIPPSFLIDSIVTRIDLQRTAIGDQLRLLPAASESTFIYRNQTVRRNLIRFSGCRQYSGESRLVFDEVK